MYSFLFAVKKGCKKNDLHRLMLDSICPILFVHKFLFIRLKHLFASKLIHNIMEALSNKLLKYNDYNYRKAVNYRQWLYNFPITFNYGKKHHRVKYIIGAGTADNISIRAEENLVYIISLNLDLDYISMTVIDTDKNTTSEVFLSANDITLPDSPFEGILFQSTEEQIKQLSLFY